MDAMELRRDHGVIMRGLVNPRAYSHEDARGIAFLAYRRTQHSSPIGGHRFIASAFDLSAASRCYLSFGSRWFAFLWCFCCVLVRVP